MEINTDWLGLGIGTLGVIMALSYFSHRVFMLLKLLIAVLRKNEQEVNRIKKQSVAKINWVLLSGAIIFIFLYKWVWMGN